MRELLHHAAAAERHGAAGGSDQVADGFAASVSALASEETAPEDRARIAPAEPGMNLRDRLFVSSDPVAGSRILSERILTVRCAWCRLVIRPGGSRISDGICPSCLARELAA